MHHNIATSAGMPLVSVTIPAYNAAETLAAAIDSVLAQTHTNLELIVVDDGSTDATWGVLQSYGERIRSIRQRNGGLAVARNTGVHAARGEFIALMDADDLCEPGRLAAQLRFLQAHPDLLLCGSDFSAFNGDGQVSERHLARYYSRCSAAAGGVQARYPRAGEIDLSGIADLPPRAATFHGMAYDEIAQGNFVHPPTVMFRRRVLEEVGAFDPGARSMCDWDWLARVARRGPIGHLDLALLRYRLSSTQMSSSPRAAVDSLHVAQRICRRDPELLQRHPAAFRHLLGELHADAADVQSQRQRWQALRLLAASVLRYGWLTHQTPRTLLKILLPTGLLAQRRRARAT